MPPYMQRNALLPQSSSRKRSVLCSSCEADADRHECFHLTHSSSCSCLLPKFPPHTLFLVLLSPAQSLSLCTTSLLGAVCHSNMIPVSGHPFTYLATRLSLGLDMDLEHTLTACCMSGLSTAQQFSMATALLYKLVLSAFRKSGANALSLWL